MLPSCFLPSTPQSTHPHPTPPKETDKQTRACKFHLPWYFSFVLSSLLSLSTITTEQKAADLQENGWRKIYFKRAPFQKKIKKQKAKATFFLRQKKEETTFPKIYIINVQSQCLSVKVLPLCNRLLKSCLVVFLPRFFFPHPRSLSFLATIKNK